MRIGQTSLVVFVSKLVGSVLAFFATIYFARVLGAEILGYFALAITVAKWLRMSGDVGVASAVTKRVSEGESRSEYFTAGMLLAAVLAIITVVVVIIFRDLLNAYVGADVAAYIGLVVVIGLFGSIVGAGLQGERLVHIFGVLTPIRMSARSLAQLALVIVGFQLSGMLVGYAVGGAIALAVGATYLSVGFTRPHRHHFRSLFEYAKYSWLGSLRGRSFADVDFIVLGALVSPALVGVYSIAWNISNFIGLFGSSISQTTFPEMSRADALRRRQRLADMLSDSLAYSGLIGIPGLLGGIVLGDRILRIYGEEFVNGTSVLGILIFAIVIYGYQRQLINGLDAIDRPDLSFRVSAVFIVFNFGLNVGLVSAMGFAGAAVATALAAAIGLVLAFIYLRRLVAFELPALELTRQLLAAGLMALVVGGARAALEVSTLVNNNVVIVVVLGLLGVVVYFAVLLGISPRFRKTVARNLPDSLRPPT